MSNSFGGSKSAVDIDALTNPFDVCTVYSCMNELCGLSFNLARDLQRLVTIDPKTS